jgi:hypothetical protein
MPPKKVDPNLTLAILRYKGAADEEPTTQPIEGGHALQDTEMHVSQSFTCRESEC